MLVTNGVGSCMYSALGHMLAAWHRTSDLRSANMLKSHAVEACHCAASIDWSACAGAQFATSRSWTIRSLLRRRSTALRSLLRRRQQMLHHP